jgi:hypothetical protein
MCSVQSLCYKTNYFCSLLISGFITAVVTIVELARGKELLVMRSWVFYVRSIMVKRDLMRHLYCVCIEANYLCLMSGRESKRRRDGWCERWVREQ